MGRNGNDVFVLGEESLAADDFAPRGDEAEDFVVAEPDKGDFVSSSRQSRAASPFRVGPRFAARRRLAVLAIGAAMVVLTLVLLHGGPDSGDGVSAGSSSAPQAQAPPATVQPSPAQHSPLLALSRSHPVGRRPVGRRLKARRRHKLEKRPRGVPEREPNSESAPVGPPVDEPAPAPVSPPIPTTEPAPVSSPPDPSPPPTGGGGSVERPEFGFER